VLPLYLVLGILTIALLKSRPWKITYF